VLKLLRKKQLEANTSTYSLDTKLERKNKVSYENAFYCLSGKQSADFDGNDNVNNVIQGRIYGKKFDFSWQKNITVRKSKINLEDARFVCLHFPP